MPEQLGCFVTATEQQEAPKSAAAAGGSVADGWPQDEDAPVLCAAGVGAEHRWQCINWQLVRRQPAATCAVALWQSTGDWRKAAVLALALQRTFGGGQQQQQLQQAQQAVVQDQGGQAIGSEAKSSLQSLTYKGSSADKQPTQGVLGYSLGDRTARGKDQSCQGKAGSCQAAALAVMQQRLERTRGMPVAEACVALQEVVAVAREAAGLASEVHGAVLDKVGTPQHTLQQRKCACLVPGLAGMASAPVCRRTVSALKNTSRIQQQ